MPIQDHCHISSTLQVAGEKAPDKSYKAIRRRPSYLIPLMPNRGLTGRLFIHRLVDVGGDPIVFTDFEYMLKVTPTELTALEAELGRSVYFCDHDHPDDGEDHTSVVRTMLFSELQHVKDYDPKLTYFDVMVKLIDGDTVN